MPTPTLYSDFRLRQHNGNAIDLDAAGAVKVALVTSAYVPNTVTDSLFSGISANEVTGAGYTAGGVTVANATLALNGSGVPVWSHDDVTWAQNASGFTTARYAVWYASGTGRLIMVLDLGANRGVVNGPLTLDGSPSTGVVQF